MTNFNGAFTFSTLAAYEKNVQAGNGMFVAIDSSVADGAYVR